MSESVKHQIVAETEITMMESGVYLVWTTGNNNAQPIKYQCIHSVLSSHRKIHTSTTIQFAVSRPHNSLVVWIMTLFAN